MRNNAFDALNPIKCIHTLKNIFLKTQNKKTFMKLNRSAWISHAPSGSQHKVELGEFNCASEQLVFPPYNEHMKHSRRAFSLFKAI